MTIQFYISTFLILIFLSACAEVSDSPTQLTQTDNWLIPRDQIFDGGPGKDGIPALTNPTFINVSDADFMESKDLVLVARVGQDIRAYPHRILDWHEIINDTQDNNSIVVSYCPLTGSGMGYSGYIMADGQTQKTTYGVSGLLYNSNLILYDRLTDSYWSQMRLQCVAGKLFGQTPEMAQMLETTFSTIKALYPEAKIVSNFTQVYNVRQYQFYPYGDYLTNHNNLIFPIAPDDTRLPRKERVLGIIGSTTSRVYQFESFYPGIQIINDEIDGTPFVLAGSKTYNFIVAFSRLDANGNEIQFKPTTKNFPAIIEDAQGNVYDLFGSKLEGPGQNTQLKPMKSFIAFWFAWGAFQPGIEIYNQ